MVQETSEESGHSQQPKVLALLAGCWPMKQVSQHYGSPPCNKYSMKYPTNSHGYIPLNRKSLFSSLLSMVSVKPRLHGPQIPSSHLCFWLKSHEIPRVDCSIPMDNPSSWIPLNRNSQSIPINSYSHLPSGNQTWQWKNGSNAPLISDCPTRISICRGFSSQPCLIKPKGN